MRGNSTITFVNKPGGSKKKDAGLQLRCHNLIKIKTDVTGSSVNHGSIVNTT